MLSLSIKVIYSGMNAPWRRYNFGIWVKLKKNTLMPLRIWIPIYQCQVKLVRNQKCASIHPFSTAQNAQNSTYSSIQNKNILSVTQWELLLFHVLTLELFIALELTQKELSQTKIFGGSIVQVKILAACKILGKWTFMFVISSTLCCKEHITVFLQPRHTDSRLIPNPLT